MDASTVRAGRRFGRLEVLAEDEPYLWRGRFARRRWFCRCDCGRETTVRDDRLKAGTTLSCSCLRNDVARKRLLRHGGKAGGRAAPEYYAWQAMLHRQDDATVCRRWRTAGGVGYANFLADVGHRPGPGYRLVRPDAARAFAPGNCRWVLAPPRKGVPRRFVAYRGRLLSLKAAAAVSGVGYARLCKRLERGWAPAQALRAQ